MPLIKFRPGGFTRLSRIILVENSDGLMLVCIKGREGNLLVGTQIRNLRMLVPLDGTSGAPTADHPLCRFIPCSGCFGQF
jgi:hypothetical protein